MKITLSLSAKERIIVKHTTEELHRLSTSLFPTTSAKEPLDMVNYLTDARIIHINDNAVSNETDYSFSIDEDDFENIVTSSSKFMSSITHSIFSISSIVKMIINTTMNTQHELEGIGSKITDKLFKKRLKETTSGIVYNSIINNDTIAMSPIRFAKNAQQVIIDDITNRINTSLMLDRDTAKTYEVMSVISWSGTNSTHLQVLYVAPIDETPEAFKELGRSRVIAYNNFILLRTVESYKALIEAMTERK